MRESHRQRISPFADVHRGDGRLADPRLDDILHIGHVHAVARGLISIQFDLHLRNRRFLEKGGARSTLDAVKNVHDLAADTAQLVQVIAEDFDHQRAVGAADHVVDAIDDGLTDADGIARQSWRGPPPFCLEMPFWTHDAATCRSR